MNPPNGQPPAPYGQAPAPAYGQAPAPAYGQAPAPAYGQAPQFGAAFDTADAGAEINRVKLPYGEHLCQIESCHDKTGFKGYSLILEFRAIAGPAAGTKTSDVFQPFKNPQFQQKEFGKIKACIGAAFGYTDLADQTRHVTAQVLEECKRGALIGRLLLVEAYPSARPNRETGQPYTLYRYRAYLEDGRPVTRPLSTGVSAADVHAAPPPAAAPTPAPFPPPGWQLHPTAPADPVGGPWYYCGSECKTEKQLREGA